MYYSHTGQEIEDLEMDNMRADAAEERREKMKLSQAIREGAKHHPQGFEWFYMEGCTCALGAAYRAKFGVVPSNDDRIITEELQDEWSELFEEVEGIPNYPLKSGSIQAAVVWMNDNQKTSREDIAAWLEERGY